MESPKNQNKEAKNTIKEKLIGSGISLLVLAFFLIFKPQCPFISFFGIPCPGCGMTRAYYKLFQLDIAGAFQLNAMFWSVPILAVYYFFDWKLFKNKIIDTVVLSLLGLGFLVCWIIKLI